MLTDFDVSKAAKLGDGVYWIGFPDYESGFMCHPYVLVDGDEAVLFDPGSVPDYPTVVKKLLSVVNPLRIRYIVLHHQDPDVGASTTRFEELTPNCQIVTTWRAGTLIKHYGVKSPFYFVDRHQWKLTLKSGRELHFYNAQFLHSPGAFFTYDPTSRFLFTSDVFGAFSYEWRLVADENYPEAMKAFHEPYMASSHYLATALSRIENLPIRGILPQHGSLILNDPKKYIKILMNLPVGADLDE